MAKDDRQILRAVRIGGEAITDADRLEQKATPKQIASLMQRGYVTGFNADTPREDGGEDLSKLKLEDLRTRAVNAGIEGAETMKKAELIEALEK